jgi:hypothetical protein
LSGPPAGTGCAVCAHPDAAQINSEINSRSISARQIAKTHGIGKDSVNRHIFKRHPGYVVPGKEGEKSFVPDGATEMERLVTIRGQLEAEMQVRPRSDTSRELRGVIRRIAEIQGADRPKSVGVADVRGLPEQIRRWFEALEPYPDARDAMLAVTDPKLMEPEG